MAAGAVTWAETVFDGGVERRVPFLPKVSHSEAQSVEVKGWRQRWGKGHRKQEHCSHCIHLCTSLLSPGHGTQREGRDPNAVGSVLRVSLRHFKIRPQ